MWSKLGGRPPSKCIPRHTHAQKGVGSDHAVDTERTPARDDSSFVGRLPMGTDSYTPYQASLPSTYSGVTRKQSADGMAVDLRIRSRWVGLTPPIGPALSCRGKTFPFVAVEPILPASPVSPDSPGSWDCPRLSLSALSFSHSVSPCLTHHQDTLFVAVEPPPTTPTHVSHRLITHPQNVQG
ncbi:hypothetical protein LY76DRAFT_80232 [Colletotrichum caudatum]|nr:hypothetical protein LY76DRAFT_80232 [Colletotrichum caudatum]